MLYVASVAFLALGMTACGGATEEAETATVYNVDATATELMWQGDYADATHSHMGTVSVTDGMISYMGDEFEKGMFTVDLSTTKSTDLTPEMGSDKLIGHLSTEDFFNSAKFPNVEVTINSMTDKEIDATLKVAGKEIKTTFPATIKRTGNKLTAKADFSVDFSGLNAVGFKANPEMEKEKPNQFVKPMVGFKLNLVMNAEKPAAK